MCKKVLSQLSSINTTYKMFCAHLCLRPNFEKILLLAIPCGKILDPNSAPKRARELRHLCAMLKNARHWENGPPQMVPFYNHNHFTTMEIEYARLVKSTCHPRARILLPNQIEDYILLSYYSSTYNKKTLWYQNSTIL